MANQRLGIGGQRYVLRRIVAGDTNEQIRQKLAKTGYPSEITDAALSRYRNRPSVLKWIERRDNEAMQQGAAQYGRRVQMLSRIALAVEGRLFMDETSEDFAAGRPEVILPWSREMRDALAQIADERHKAEMRRLAAEKSVREATAAAAALPDEEGEGDIPTVIVLPSNGRDPKF